MSYSYVIIDDDVKSVLEIQAFAQNFTELVFIDSANNYETALDLILESKPDLIFLEIDPVSTKSKLSLLLINELHRCLNEIPHIIITTKTKRLAFDCIKFQVFDFILKPISHNDLVKLILKLEKIKVSVPLLNVNGLLEKESAIKGQQALILCIKSYGDYRYADTRDITYLKADNNSTDIQLYTGEMITAFKTLKHFEAALYYPFVRIHNSYIVNSRYISRIHTGNANCHIKNSATKIPFSKTYKSNIDLIISKISSDNYLEI